MVARSIGLSEVRIDGEDVYWVESRPHEAGRNVVVRRVPGSAAGRDVNPAPFNVRTRVHEYGGGAWNVSAGVVYLTNFADSRLYRVTPDWQSPKPLSPPGAWRWADGTIDTVRSRWIGVQEDHTAGQPINRIVSIDADRGWV